MVRVAVPLALLASCELRLAIPIGSRGCCSFHFRHHNCFSQKHLPCTTIVFVKIGNPSDVEMCPDLTSSSKDVPQRFPIYSRKTVVPRPDIRAWFRQQSSSASLGKSSRRYNVLVQAQHRCRSAKRRVHTRLCLCLSYSALFALRVFRHRLPRRSVLRSFGGPQESVAVLTTHIDDRTPQLSVFHYSRVVLLKSC